MCVAEPRGHEDGRAWAQQVPLAGRPLVGGLCVRVCEHVCVCARLCACLSVCMRVRECSCA